VVSMRLAAFGVRVATALKPVYTSDRSILVCILTRGVRQRTNDACTPDDNTFDNAYASKVRFSALLTVVTGVSAARSCH
jgi:hypothetical protein